ncbi:MAG: tetraacyldisaccharide 4'-kinase [Bacteroidales bacterium]|nr:tetraacyldisaccharide 4'-kinase [Bacteroidales bacterium]
MIDKILLFPYWLTLKLRHFMYDCGLRKAYRPEVPSICVGNITVGGTGKTPHTEMLIRTLLEDDEWGTKNIAVLSRGYKRRSKGFQQVMADGTAKEYGDEPLQIKRKFPLVTVAVDKSRTKGCRYLCEPETVKTSKKTRKCRFKDFPKADLIILDDAFQHRAVKASVDIVLVDFSRPVFKDHLMPMGRLRDLPERISDADIIIVSKCPAGLDAWEKSKWAQALGLSMYDAAGCCGLRKNGKKQHIFFTKISYDTAAAIFPEGDARYLYSKRLILFSGIANDAPLQTYLSSDYKIVRHFNFPDHHKFSKADIMSIKDAADTYQTSVVMTTEKDCQRVRDCGNVPDNLKQRMFYTPIKTGFLSDEDKSRFSIVLKTYLK